MPTPFVAPPLGRPYQRAADLLPFIEDNGVLASAAAIGIARETLVRVLSGLPVYRGTAKKLDRFLDSRSS